MPPVATWTPPQGRYDASQNFTPRLLVAKTGRPIWSVRMKKICPPSTTATAPISAPAPSGQPAETFDFSKASIRAFSASFSSRAFWAMARTASNSSRVTKSRSASQRSIQPFIAVSASVRAPWATPIAFVISFDMSSKNLFGPVIWHPPSGISAGLSAILANMCIGTGKLKVDFVAGRGSERSAKETPDACRDTLSRHL